MNSTISPVAIAGFLVFANCGGSGSSTTTNQELVATENSTTISVGDAGAKFDNATELQTGFQGLGLKDVYIVDGNDNRIKGNEVSLNTTFSIIYEGVTNFMLINGKVFPSLSILVTDDQQNIIINESNLLSSYTEGLSEADASVLRATITAGEPMKPGSYLCTIQVNDKNNLNAAISSTWTFDVK